MTLMSRFEFTTLLGLAALVASCGGTGAAAPPAMNSGASLVVTNTIQIARPVAEGGTAGVEVPIEALLGAPADSLRARGKLNPDTVEFAAFLGLWDVDFSNDSIAFRNIVTEATQPFPGFLRVIEAGTFDRYYITISPDYLGRPKVDKPFVSVERTGVDTLEVTIGEGYDNRQSGFTITFE